MKNEEDIHGGLTCESYNFKGNKIKSIKYWSFIIIFMVEYQFQTYDNTIYVSRFIKNHFYYI